MKNLYISLSATPILYHLTNSYAAVSILRHNEFHLKPAEGTSSEEDLTNNSYYLSTTRHRLGGYTLSSIYKNSVIFVLNGTKLNQRYKIIPVDYWKARDMEGISKETRTKYEESEDRVLSKKPKIKANPYILEIHAHINDHSMNLKRFCLYKKIPIYFYSNIKDLLLMNKKNSVKVNIEYQKKKEKSGLSKEYQILQYKDRRKNYLIPWLELYYKPLNKKLREKDKKLSKEAKSLIERIAYFGYGDFYSKDIINAFNADLHNYKTKEYNGLKKERESLDKIILILRKNKWNTKDFISYIHNKWLK